jgi:hypothetical protein
MRGLGAIAVGFVIGALGTAAVTSLAESGTSRENLMHPGASRGPEAAPVDRRDGDRANADPEVLTPTRPSGPRPESGSAAARGAQAGIVLHGTLRDDAGAAIQTGEDGSWISLTGDDGNPRNLGADASGHYAIPGLSPGTWRVRVRSVGFRPLEDELQLAPDAAVVRHDFVLQTSVGLDVRGFTPDGQPLLAALSDRVPAAEWMVRLTAVATAEPPPQLLPPIGERARSAFGIGLYHDRWEEDVEDLPPDAMGRLEVFEPLPAFVSLVLRHVVLQTVRVERGATSVTFSVPWDLVAAQFGSVRVRAVDAQTRRPPADVTASLSDSQSFSGGTHPNADGDFIWRDQLPGLLNLRLSCPGYETWAAVVTVPPGGEVDLGTVALDAEVHIAGVVRDDEGRPQSVWLSAARVDQDAETASFVHGFYSWQSDATGRFKIEHLGRHDYEIRVASGAWVRRPNFVSTRGGDVDDAVVLVARGTGVTVDVRLPPSGSWAVEIVGKDGTIALPRTPWAVSGSSTWTVAPGDYEARLFGEGGLVRNVPFTVGSKPMLVSLTP